MRIAVFTVLLSLTSVCQAADSEPPSVERAARWYRIQIYESYRTDRAEYNRRRELGDQMLREWQNVGSPDEPSPMMIDWFLAARDASLPDSDALLPELPSIDFQQYAKATVTPPATGTLPMPATTYAEQLQAAEADAVPPAVAIPAESSSESSVGQTEAEQSDAGQNAEANHEATGGSTIRSLGGAVWRAMTE